jgi:hypothetical protein
MKTRTLALLGTAAILAACGGSGSDVGGMSSGQGGAAHGGGASPAGGAGGMAAGGAGGAGGAAHGGGPQGGGSQGGAGGGVVLPECAPLPPAATLLAQAKALAEGAGKGRRAVWKSVFGLADDGTIAPGGIPSIDWDPSHDSVWFTSLDVERNVPLLVSNVSPKDRGCPAEC